MLRYRGETLTLAAWSQKTGVSVGTLESRVKRGWPVKRILETPKVDRRFSMTRAKDDLGPLPDGLPASRHDEYIVWRGMVNRCYNERATSYANYGGRGIKVCARWRRSFKNFYTDMGPRPKPGRGLIQIDRIDNDDDYKPKNCRWATHMEQAQNRGHDPSRRRRPNRRR